MKKTGTVNLKEFKGTVRFIKGPKVSDETKELIKLSILAKRRMRTRLCR